MFLKWRMRRRTSAESLKVQIARRGFWAAVVELLPSDRAN